MDQTGIIELIRRGVPTEARATWADFGAGTGNFTRALAQLLAPQSIIYAVEHGARTLQHLQMVAAREASGSIIKTIHADFTHPLTLPPLDGALMANSLHFNQDQERVLALIAGYLRPGGRLLIIEYDIRVPRPWIPHPVPFTRLTALAAKLDLSTPQIVGTHASRWSANGRLYAALMRSLSQQ